MKTGCEQSIAPGLPTRIARFLAEAKEKIWQGKRMTGRKSVTHPLKKRIKPKQ